jgi:Kef-type K+ transport system membrane component KefB
MVAGIMLGPSVCGKLTPGVSAWLFPPESLSHIAVLSQVALVLFVFLVGLSLDSDALKECRNASLLTSHASIVLPFCMGAALTPCLYVGFAGPGVSVKAFALFMGAAMSITAFPVLARILTERDLLRSRTGTLAIACAAIDDVTGWCIFAYITVMIQSSRSTVPFWLSLSGCVTFIAFMRYGMSPLMKRLDHRTNGDGAVRESFLVAITLLMLGSAVTTELLGIHALFGSFIAGAILPKDSGLVGYVREKFEPLTLLLFLPLFFAFTGLRTSIGLIQSTGMWLSTVMILLVAVAGKLGGSALAARWAGFSWRDSAAVGALMNTRGLMELVILNIALDLKVITPPLFTMMVIMAIATTLMTAPLLSWLQPVSLVFVETAPLGKGTPDRPAVAAVR